MTTEDEGLGLTSEDVGTLILVPAEIIGVEGDAITVVVNHDVAITYTQQRVKEIAHEIGSIIFQELVPKSMSGEILK